MYRSLDIKEEPLPEGTYYLEYEVTDAFMRTTKSERIEFRWDGKKMTFPNDDAWKGSFVGGNGTSGK